MAKYVLKRVLMALFTIFLVATLTFFLMKAVPGNPFVSEKTPPQSVLDALNEKYGLDQPLSVQYFKYMSNLLRGDLGVSVKMQKNYPVISIIKEMLENEVSDDLKALKERVAKLVDLYEAAINKVKEANDQAVHDFLARRLYNMTGDIVMSLLILDDATKAPEMFAKSANVYVRMAEEEVLGHSAYIQNFKAEDLESFKA